jgi:cytochrome oxidase assembly protein ShyY1
VYRFALQPRWLAFHLLAVVVALGCVRAGEWQFSRWEARSDANATIEAGAARDPVPVTELVGAGQTGDGVSEAEQWRPVTATGRYDETRTVLLRNRTGGGGQGFEVLVPLVTDDGAALLVNRGWIMAARSATEVVDVPAPPTGEVRVTGRLRASQESSERQRQQATTTPQRSVVRIDVGWLAQDLPYPLYGGYAEVIEEEPAPAEAPEPIPAPDLGTGPHLAYAFQWWVFAIVALVGWVLLMRREARDRRTAQAQETDARVPAATGT